jgi:hypothetical protein
MEHQTYLKLTRKSIKQQCKKDQSTTVVKTRTIILQVKKHRPQHKRHDKVKYQRRDSKSRISQQSPPTSPKSKLHLRKVRDCIWRLGSLVLELLRTAGGFILFETLRGRVVCFVRGDFLQEGFALGARLPALGEFLGSSGGGGFEA